MKIDHKPNTEIRYFENEVIMLRYNIKHDMEFKKVENLCILTGNLRSE